MFVCSLPVPEFRDFHFNPCPRVRVESSVPIEVERIDNQAHYAVWAGPLLVKLVTDVDGVGIEDNGGPEGMELKCQVAFLVHLGKQFVHGLDVVAAM